MSGPAKVNFKIYQGSTFRENFRWESGTIGYAAITNVTKAAPCVITAPNHGIKVGWSVGVSNVQGMVELNTTDEESYTVTDVTQDTVTFNDINTLGAKAYAGGGVLVYFKPPDLTDYVARMQIRRKLTDEEVVLELTTENGGIEIDVANCVISIYISAEQTEQLGFKTGVYSLELDLLGEVTQLIAGTISLVLEVTR